MFVNFERISVKGFLSMAEADLDLSNQGVVFVTGKNEAPGNQDSNGAGKSTLFEAVMYALTGTTLRGTKDVINLYWDGYAEVTLTLSVDGVEYIITRTRNHPTLKNNLKILKDGKDISGDKLKKSEAILKEELGQLTSSLISSVIILGQGLPNKFTDLSPIARKDRLEELSQSSEFIGEFKTRLTNFKDMYTLKRDENNMNIARTETMVRTNEDRVHELAVKLDELLKNGDDKDLLQSELSAVNSDISGIKNNMKVLSESRHNTENVYSSVSTEKQIKENQKRDESREISRLLSEIANLEESVCPTCHQPIKSHGDIQALKSERMMRVSELRNNSFALDSAIKEAGSKEELLSKKIEGIDKRYRDLQDSFYVKSKKSTEIQARIDKLNDTSTELQDGIDLYSSRANEEKAKLQDLSQTGGVYELKLGILDYLSKKSSKEFRSFMLIGVIDYLNTKLAYYSEKLFGTSQLFLVLDGNRISIKYDNRPYENLSGGERQRADLAMQFSLRDMLINSLGFNCNLLVIDEGFDNLDESGVMALISVINEMSAIDSVFTISHHTLSIPFDKTIEVVKGLDKVSTVHETI